MSVLSVPEIGKSDPFWQVADKDQNALTKNTSEVRWRSLVL
jgi:hypothetical protein